MSLYHLVTFHKNAECLFFCYFFRGLSKQIDIELRNEFVKTVTGGTLKDIFSSQKILTSLIETGGHKVSW